MRESSKPSRVAATAFSRWRAGLASGISVTRRQRPAAEPRPTRPRSWWSWETPKRSASMITIAVALGTLTPTSMTVVATRTSVSPAAKRRITASLSSGCIRPCRTSTREALEGPLGELVGDVEDGERRALLGLVLGGLLLAGLLRVVLLVPDARADDVRLMAVADLLAHPLPGARQEVGLVGGRDDMAGDRRAAGRELVEDGGLQVAEDGHGDRARDGRGRHDEQVGRLLALAAQGVALLDAEAVLFVDDDQAEVVELHLVLDQRVRADDDPGLAGDQVEQRLAAGGRAHGPGQQHHLGGLLGAAQHAALGQLAHHLDDRAVVLLGEHLGGREHGGLTAGVDDGEHGAQRHHRVVRDCEVVGDVGTARVARR